MKKKALVIGAGLAGMSAAIRLRADGYEVKVLEKNGRVGGKLNRLASQGFIFDTGSTILTMPWVLEQLFASVHRRLEDYIPIKRVEPHSRVFFEDGVQLDLTSDLPELIAEMKRVGNGPKQSVLKFLNYSEELYELHMKSFYKYSLTDSKDMKKHHNLRELMAMEAMSTVAEGTKKRLDNPHLEQLFNHFALDSGSNPYQAPAILNQSIYVQLALGIYYVPGGMYNIARGMERVLDELEVEVQLNSSVDSLVLNGETVTGAHTIDGVVHEADIVVSNLGAIPVYRNLIMQKKAKKEAKRLNKTFIPSASGMVMLLGVDRKFENFTHHNLFLSKDPEKEFKDIFEKGIPTDDPTVYVGISSRTDASQAPEGKDSLYVLTHVPAIKEGQQDKEDWNRYREIILDKLERMGMDGLRDSIEFEDGFTPKDLEALYGSNGGSIYGVASDKKKNGGFKIPARSELYKNLYFVGATTHPGGGLPSVILSGQLTADLIKKNEGLKE
ncbi:MAG TPA: phytoene desaturase family protein [Planococcus sp. (in: firmicutes)]|nr:phytoene desaturase family protein [Planococcus sp. (in: firmicutes)]